MGSQKSVFATELTIPVAHRLDPGPSPTMELAGFFNQTMSPSWSSVHVEVWSCYGRSQDVVTWLPAVRAASLPWTMGAEKQTGRGKLNCRMLGENRQASQRHSEWVSRTIHHNQLVVNLPWDNSSQQLPWDNSSHQLAVGQLAT